MELICEYIQELVSKGELTKWSVVLMNKTTRSNARETIKKHTFAALILYHVLIVAVL